MQTFHPASSIDLDERTVALGTIALGGAGLEEYELEFPASEPDLNLLPEHDDNLLSLHDARRKVLLTGGRGSRSSMESSASSRPAVYDLNDDLLTREIDSSVEIERGGDESQMEVSRTVDPYEALDFDVSQAAVDFGDVYRGPDDLEFPDFNINGSTMSAPLESSVQEPAPTFPVPTSGARSKRTWAELVDKHSTVIEDASLRKQIANKFYHDGPNRVAAPQTREELKRENILESINLPILRNTPIPLRPLFSKALDQRNEKPARGRAGENDDIFNVGDQDLNTSLPNVHVDASAGEDIGPDIYRGEDDEGARAHRYNQFGGFEPSAADVDLPDFESMEYKAPEVDISGELEESRIDTQSVAESSTSVALSSFAKQILTHVRRDLKRANHDSDGPYTFHTTFSTQPPKELTRRQVAQSFLALLELKTKNHIELTQEEPYGDIEFEFLNNPIDASQLDSSSQM